MSANNSQRTNFLGYDIFKLIVTLILLIILILLLLRGCGSAGGLADVTEQATAQPSAASTKTSQPIELATTEPTATVPAITSPKDGAQVVGPTITLEGTGQPGSELEIFETSRDATTRVQAVTVGSDGEWSAQVDAGEGQHVYFAATAGGPGSNAIKVTVTAKIATPTLPPIPTRPALPTATPAVASDGAGCGADGAIISGYLKDKDHYVVGSCDTLSGIAIWLDVTVDSLLESNPQITDPDTIIPGQIVNVPPKPE